MNFPSFFRPNRKKKEPLSPASADSENGVSSTSSPKSVHRKRSPRLDRSNAAKNFDYDTVVEEYCDWSIGSDCSSSSNVSLRTRSLDVTLPSCAERMSFRIDGEVEGEVEILCRSLGLSGPEDFAIPLAAWEQRKTRCSSDLLPRSRIMVSAESQPDRAALLVRSDAGADAVEASSSSLKVCDKGAAPRRDDNDEEDLWRDLPERFSATCRIENGEELVTVRSTQFFTKADVSDRSGGGGGIRGTRPPVLAPPPPMTSPVFDNGSSTWDLLRSFAPQAENVYEHDRALGQTGKFSPGDHKRTQEVNEGIDERIAEEDSDARLGVTVRGELTGSYSFSTSNEDDSSSTTTEVYISPNCRFRLIVGEWQKGRELGRGSYGTVYEAISNDGFFFAVKEVSLLDQGREAQQCIVQLEHEITLLSQFEHENIVQYLGTEKGETKLYIFLELVTQGSLASLYHKYRLGDSQVSAYTRQILNGLKYLHEQNIVHRDIKCANILVAADGSVKLADFGLAKETEKFDMLKSCKGSIYWMAPEVINPQKTYGLLADIWSLGCTVLEMLTRNIPYPNLEFAQAFYKIGHGTKPDIPDTLSRDAHDFIYQCVQVNPDDRPTAAKLLDHPFVKRQPSVLDSSPDSSSHGRRANVPGASGQ